MDVFEERPMLCILQHQVHIFCVLKAVVELTDMRVVQLFLDLDFPFQDVLSLVFVNLLFRDDLERVEFAGRLLADETD